jgi:hypothetical protein
MRFQKQLFLRAFNKGTGIFTCFSPMKMVSCKKLVYLFLRFPEIALISGRNNRHRIMALQFGW